VNSARRFRCAASSRPTIRRRPALLPTCPEGLTWDRCAADTGFRETELQAYLRLLADRCRAVGTALIGVVADKNGLVLGFLPADKLSRFGELAVAAEVEIIVYGSL